MVMKLISNFELWLIVGNNKKGVKLGCFNDLWEIRNKLTSPLELNTKYFLIDRVNDRESEIMGFDI